MDAVRCYVDKAQNCWDEHLVHIAGALRSAVNRNSGFTAKKLMLGWGVNIPVDLLYPAPRRGTPALQTAHESARGASPHFRGADETGL